MSRVDADAMRRYEQTRDALAQHLLELEPLLAPDARAALQAARGRLIRGKFVLAVVGEFSSGKSFLLNALLGRFRYETVGGHRQLVGLLATDINPSTATITELHYADRDEATAIFEDGRRERIPLDALNRFIAVGASDGAGTLHDSTREGSGAPARVVVDVDSAFLRRGFVVADTPGLASANPAHRRATLGFLPTADAVLYLIDTQQPFTEGDAAFLGIVRKHIDSIFVVQTKIDLWTQTHGDGRTAWEHAHERIASLAALHAPGTYVYAVSAREYAEGSLDNDTQRVESSLFPRFLSALDASLIAKTGRARLRRAAETARELTAFEIARCESDLAMLALDEDALRAQRAEVLPELERVDQAIATERMRLRDEQAARRGGADRQAAALRDNVEHALSQAFDTTDVAKLRDRARLNIIVDRVFAQSVGEIARALVEPWAGQSRAALDRASAHAALRFSLADAAARAFDAEPGTSLWSGDLQDAIRSTIVLEAIGTIAVDLVADIASRFASRPPGTYMKRELIADLRAEIFPRLRIALDAFAHDVTARLARIDDAIGTALAQATIALRDGRLGSVDRALSARASGTAHETASAMRTRIEAMRAALVSIDGVASDFLGHEDEIAPPDAGRVEVRTAHVGDAFDRASYERGLVATRWRVAVLGALRRGKSGLINAIAGRDVLRDDAAGSARFPIHVRYGERDAAYALASDGAWREIAVERAIDEAAQGPVLLLVPWQLPRELVLVHAPPFDAGDEIGEDVSLVAAAEASEVLCLFSRQLSDRELDLYERVADLGKPMSFVHTIADNETSAERRHVVALAEQYLRERSIASQRTFTVSAHDFVAAAREQRATAPWNELGALVSILEAHAQAHMDRMARLTRATAAPAPGPSGEQPRGGNHPKKGLFARLFGKGREAPTRRSQEP